MLTIDLFEDFNKEPAFIQALRDFLPVALKVLDLDHVPKIKLKKELKDTHVPTFGRFTNDEQVVYCVINNRHPNDILRTLAHEMAHYAQGQRDELDADSWHTGSPIENQANAQAGVIMREFNKQFPKYMTLKPIVVEKWSQKYKKSINCSNPKGFSQKAHCAGRKKHTNEAEDSCPPATQDIALNLKNRQKAINEYGYGPLNPLEPNVKFWAKKQQMWQLDSIDDAKKSLCGNCAAFDVSKDAIACIERGIGDDSGSENPHDVVEAGDLGYCRFLKFKCASLRTCDAWVVGGPITESKENKPVTIHTNPNYRGATIGAGVKEQLPITKMPIDQLQMWESDKTLRTKKVRDWVKNTLIPKLQDKGRLMPLIVWNRKGQHFVIDGNHRYLAYKAVKFQGDVPVKVVPQEMVAINNKVLEPVDENFADGKGPGRPGDSQRHGIPKGATIAQLEKAAKAPGRKGQLARWQINMRRGKKK